MTMLLSGTSKLTNAPGAISTSLPIFTPPYHNRVSPHIAVVTDGRYTYDALYPRVANKASLSDIEIIAYDGTWINHYVTVMQDAATTTNLCLRRYLNTCRIFIQIAEYFPDSASKAT